jgi:hypothetical protein
MKAAQLFLAAVTAFVIVGCGQDSVGNTSEPAPTAADIKKRVADIDARTDMPPQAKAMAKAMAERNGTGQKGMGTASGGK